MASDGFTVDRPSSTRPTPNIDWFNDIPSTAAIYLDPDGTPRDVGSTLRNPDLARTYRHIARMGRTASTAAHRRRDRRGAQDPPIADDANHAWRPGLITLDDLRRYARPRATPTRIGYRGLDVWGIGPPSSGGSTVGEALNILEGYSDLPPTARARST